MKILFIALSLFLIPSFTCSAQDTAAHHDYKRFRTGTFEYVGLYKGDIVTRTKRKQVEYDPAVNSKLIFKIKWVSDDTYWIIFVKTVNQTNYPLHKGDIIKTKITSATDNTYSCHWQTDATGASGDVSFRKIK